MDQIIFIFGLPRAGTTLLQRLLNTSPEVVTEPEPWILLPFLSFRNPRHVKSVYGSFQAARGIDEFLEGDEEFEKGLFRHLRDYLGKRYPENRYFCEKTPRNLIYADRIRERFPSDRFIILNRNPLNVAVSIFRTFESGVLNPYKFNVDLDLGLRQLIALNRDPGKALVLRYEDIVNDPSAVLERCSRYLGLETLQLPEGDLPKLEGLMGDPTGQHRMPKVNRQSEMAYLSFVDSHYRKRWFLKFLEGIGPDNFKALGYDFRHHRKALRRHRVLKPISLRDLFYLLGRKFLEFTAFRLLARRPAERPDYILN